jgi:dihydrolipoamide dehydrogenase
MAETNYDCVVIGAGPGGYVAAIRASQLGLRCAVIEKEALGGVCLNWGCIPTKALLKSAEVYQTIKHAGIYGLQVGDVNIDYSSIVDRSRKIVSRMTKGVQFLLNKNNIDLILGTAHFSPNGSVVVENQEGNCVSYAYRFLVIATGARPKTLAALAVDEERIITYRKALALDELPKKLLVIGAGAIGVELAYFFGALGTEVTLVEVLETVLPLEDREISQTLAKQLSKAGLKIKVNTQVEQISRTGTTVQALLRTATGTEAWTGDYALVAIGMQGNTGGLGLDTLGVKVEKSFIAVDQYYRTTAPNIYAVGDVIGPPLLAHVASHEGVIAAEHFAGLGPQPLDYSKVPACTYCQPQVASIGLSEQEAQNKAGKVRIGRFPFMASGKAVATGEIEGFVKVVIEEGTEKVLGLHIIHAEATELIGEAAVILAHGVSASSVLGTIHAHPTLSEGIAEAMGQALGCAIHL